MFSARGFPPGTPVSDKSNHNRRRTMRRILRAVPIWVVLACASASRGRTPAPVADDFGSMEAEVVRRVNQYRVSHRLRALRYDAQLAAVARVHSEDMARGQAPLGHDGFTGRANAVEKFLAFKEIAENVAMNNYAHARTVAVAMNGWLKSPHHRENIEGRFDVTGVGIARARDGTYYYTQLFVARRR